ncbi:MAG: hypothetical protein ACKVVT_12100 [Dehalococcoidia bacterium]
MNAPSPHEPRPQEPAAEVEERGLIGWARAIAFGIGDTAKDVLDAGRRGAREAHDDAWDRFEAKTKHRRSKKD